MKTLELSIECSNFKQENTSVLLEIPIESEVVSKKASWTLKIYNTIIFQKGNQDNIGICFVSKAPFDKYTWIYVQRNVLPLFVIRCSLTSNINFSTCLFIMRVLQKCVISFWLLVSSGVNIHNFSTFSGFSELLH